MKVNLKVITPNGQYFSSIVKHVSNLEREEEPTKLFYLDLCLRVSLQKKWGDIIIQLRKSYILKSRKGRLVYKEPKWA